MSYKKGYRNENMLVNQLKLAGLNAVRVPLSGATSFQKHDIIIDGNFSIEVKYRGTKFTRLFYFYELHGNFTFGDFVVLDLESFVKYYQTKQLPECRDLGKIRIPKYISEFIADADALAIRGKGTKFLFVIKK